MKFDIYNSDYAHYNVKRLFVVRKDMENGTFYYICKPRTYLKGYKDILTGYKIIPEKEEYAEPLTNFYSVLAYAETALLLSRSDLLIKIAEINHYYQTLQRMSISEDMQWADNNYQMKNNYPAENLVVANVGFLSSEVSETGPIYEETNQTYFFEIMEKEEKVQYRDIYERMDTGKDIEYRELFTGFKAKEQIQVSDKPYVVKPIPFISYYPDRIGTEVSKYEFVLLLNELNYTYKNKEKIKQ